jgi:hypothetical protein
MEDNKQQSETTVLLTTVEVANLYPQFSANSLRIMRYRGESPFPHIKLGKRVFYDKADIERILKLSKAGGYETYTDQR